MFNQIIIKANRFNKIIILAKLITKLNWILNMILIIIIKDSNKINSKLMLKIKAFINLMAEIPLLYNSSNSLQIMDHIITMDSLKVLNEWKI